MAAERLITSAQQLIDRIRREVSLDGRPGAEALGAWFLGPKAENERLLADLIEEAVRHHSAVRQVTYPDPPWADPSSPDHQVSAAILKQELRSLLHRLGRYSVPFYSYRYQGHMLWDTTLPATAGYFGAMLNNQNNVAAEASPVTTALEMEVADDVCRMLGFAIPGEDGPIRPWGHITCDGSVANIEALWAARNVKLYPLAVVNALRNEPELERARGIAIECPDGRHAVLEKLSTWELLNLVADDVLALPARLETEFDLTGAQIGLIDRYSVQRLGLGRLVREYPGAPLDELAYLASATCHYSMPKGVSLLGLGTNSLIPVAVDENARMDCRSLNDALDRCLRAKQPIAAVVVVLGTTEESAVDPLDEVLDSRETYRQRGLDFCVHVDAAWGGYFASMLRPPEGTSAAAGILNRTAGDLAERLIQRDVTYEMRTFTPEMVMSDYVVRQYRVLPRADSITVDPHKAGFVPYPAGALCYRNRRMRDMVRVTAPVVYHDGKDPSVGVFGIEGSKPGAAAAAVYLSHRVIRPDQSGYGRILGRCLFNSKRLFAALVSMRSDHFVVETLRSLPDQDKATLGRFTNLTNEELWRRLAGNPAELMLFRESGSDQIIIAYALNPKIGGIVNTDPDLADEYNRRVFKRLSIEREGDDWPELFVTASEFDPEIYGRPFVDSFRGRLGLTPGSRAPMQFLISTTMDPWLTDAGGGGRNMIPALVAALQRVAEEEALKLTPLTA
jgi:glutamate/tyrosine decarboxylase-like PLP-dependent enzyme